MALPPGITPKTVTVGIASFFDGTLAEGTATITAPVNVIHTPTNRPLFSSVISKRFVDGEVSFNLAPTDAAGLNRVDWSYKLNVVVQGALVQPDPIYFLLPAAGPNTVDLDGLVTVPSSAGIPISVDVLTTEDLPAQMADVAADEDSAFAVAQRAAFEPRPQELQTLGVNAIEAKYGSGFLFKGVNLGFGPTLVGLNRGDALWKDGYNQAWIHEAIDRIADLGANVVRMMGGWYLGTLGFNETYKQRVHDAWNYAHSKGLRVIHCLCDSPDMAPWDTAREDAIEAWIPDFIAGYEDNPMMIWDPGNDLYPYTDRAITIAQAIRATGTSCLITATNGQMTTAWTYALDPYVDFHDYHFYLDQSRQSPPAFFEQHLAVTKKPILIGETGSNLDVAGNTPHVADQWQQAEYLRHVAAYVATGDVCGVLVWKLQDANTVHKFGLYDKDWNPRAQIREFVKLPTRRLDASRVLLDRRSIPVVYDNFRRPNSTTSIGTAPIGGAPANVKGVWGTNGLRGYHDSSPGGDGFNWVVWEAQSCDAHIETEFLLFPATNAGLVFRWVDANNFYYVRWDATNKVMRLTKRVAGVTTNITPPDQWNRQSNGGVDLTGVDAKNYARIAVRVVGTSIVIWHNDRVWATTDSDAGLATGTKHGLFSLDNDISTRFEKIAISVPVRYW